MWKWTISKLPVWSPLYRTVAMRFLGHFWHIVQWIVALNMKLYSYDSILWYHDARAIPTITMDTSRCSHGHLTVPVREACSRAPYDMILQEFLTGAVWCLWDMWPRRLQLPWDRTMGKKVKIAGFRHWQNYLTAPVCDWGLHKQVRIATFA